MKKFITSDLHFGHSGILRFCPETRGRFTDATHMDEEMIREWNETVSPEDEVFILGDVAFSNPQRAVQILRRLNGRLILVKGNHDYKNLKDFSFRQCFVSIHDYLEIDHNGTFVCMFHYPISEWNRCHRGSVHLYGHLHQNPSGLEHLRARNVGFDCTGKLVSLLDDIVNDALKGEIHQHH